MRRADSLEKTLMLGGVGGRRKRGQQEAEMGGWHHGLDGCEFEWTLGGGDGQGGLACCDSWGRKELDTTQWLNWSELNFFLILSISYLDYPHILAYCLFFFVRALNILTKIVLNSQSYNSHILAIPESSLDSCFESSNCFCPLLCFAIFFSKLDRKCWFWMFPLP